MSGDQATKLSSVLLDQMKHSLDLSMEVSQTELQEIEEATDIIQRHQKEWAALREDIGTRRQELKKDIQIMENLLQVKREELNQLRIEYEKRRSRLEEKQIEELKHMEDRQQAKRNEEDAQMSNTLSKMLEDIEKNRDERSVQKEIKHKREEMERKLQEEMDRLRQEKLAQLEQQLRQEENRLTEEAHREVKTESLLSVPTAVPEGLAEAEEEVPEAPAKAVIPPAPVTEKIETVAESVPVVPVIPKEAVPPVVSAEAEDEDGEEGELNCSLDDDIFTLYIDEGTLNAGSYSVVGTLRDFFQENPVKEFHIDLESIESLTSRVIELVLKLVSTFRHSNSISIKNALEHFLSTFQMLGLDKNVTIHTVPSSVSEKTAKSEEQDENDWDV
ncbi:MAG: hypothetical protein HQM12_07100 [SAR324 cluster bacterium]|nr:hypothetical protein [SAR324 cluster bacterium]